MIIMKFGGASLSSPDSVKRVINIILSGKKEKPVVVLSAMAKTTRSLLLCAEEYAAGRKDKGNRHLEDIREFHIKMAYSLLEKESLDDVLSGIEKYFAELSGSLNAFFALNELSPRSQDSVLCYGELLSSLIVERCLHQEDGNSKLLDSRKIVITDNSFTSAHPVFNETKKRIRKIISPLTDNGIIPVLQGFIGSTKDGIPTTLGFEGSDYTASIIGSGLKADAIQIWKNVPGIMSADPDIVKDAKTVKTITFSEAEELSFFGAKVLHPLSVKPARKAGISVTIRNTNDVNGEFTSIVPDMTEEKAEIKSITCLKDMLLLHFKSVDLLDIQSLFASMERNYVSICLSRYLHDRIDLVVKNTSGAERFVFDHTDKGRMFVKRRIAVVTLVGHEIGTDSSLVGRVFESLKNSGINCEVFVNSEMSFAVVLDQSFAEKAVLALHNDLLSKK